MKYSEKEIEAIFEENLNLAIRSLSDIPVAKKREPSLRGLNGWVYEQTIHSCLNDELDLLGLKYPASEQIKITGRANADLLIGNTAIEIKSGGLFGDESEKYTRYKTILNQRNISYLYITKQETHEPYRQAMKQAFGEEFCFLLSESNAWNNFVLAVISTNKTA